MPVICLGPTELDGVTLQLWLADTFADLVTIDVSLDQASLESYRQAIVTGNGTPGDGGGGLFVYLPTSTETANGNSVSTGSTGTGRWVSIDGIRWLVPPANAGASGRTNDWAMTGFFRYLCVATNTWRRVAHASF